MWQHRALGSWHFFWSWTLKMSSWPKPELPKTFSARKFDCCVQPSSQLFMSWDANFWDFPNLKATSHKHPEIHRIHKRGPVPFQSGESSVVTPQLWWNSRSFRMRSNWYPVHELWKTLAHHKFGRSNALWAEAFPMKMGSAFAKGLSLNSLECFRRWPNRW